ncbi:ABC transporter substrate-binding protein [Modestobacter sp. I12A-02628]|uniref:ABC transporter substrate-binding protein n=1 Tax=Goekera deserti TaxID=2497753 RepID=A0A7K3W8D1_9ACTN|nr:ABC transporter substrate-binding protein [Goekera deserti]MPR00234.1 ABC transporter substrate-binding protein [Goekera deserti]NDI49408.1 ABC transporter substrate-binding protein [Goekera deserti]NEL52718.1 ABC transporter substrate-binding protein [Goekera deserti]
MSSPRVALAALCTTGAVLLTGCSGDTSGESSSSGAASPSADDGQVVVALDDFAALHALTLGVRPDLVLEVFEYESTSAILDDLGVTTAPYGSELDVESVAAADPDVVIGVSIPTTVAAEEQLDAIAPTTVIDYAGSWDEQLATVAGALDRDSEADAVVSRVEEQTAEVAAALEDAGRAGAVASVVGDNSGFFSPPAATAVGSALAGVGLSRPAAQQAPGDSTSPFVLFTAETLPEQDGDVLFLLSGGPYATDALTASPLWSSLSAVTGEAVHEVSGEVWLGSSAFSVSWVLDDVRAVLLDEGEPATSADAASRFAEFTGA